MKMFRLAGAAMVFAAGAAFGASYNEAVNGDLSSDWLNPTLFSVDPGTNSISATSVSGDREYVTFTIPVGFALASITLDAFSPASGLSFIGIESGTQFTPPASTTESDLLGYTHFSLSLVGTDVLDDMGAGAGAAGFTPPLPAGDYTLWIQETGPTARTYAFTMNVVPEPHVPALLGAALLGLAFFRRRATARRR